MYIKEKFNLLANVYNIFNVNPILLRQYIVEDGVNKIVSILEVNKSVIHHNYFDKIINGIKKRDIKIIPINYENYILPVSYNPKTKDIIINIHPLGVSDISSVEIDPRNLYALVLYGLIFRNSFYKKLPVEESNSISNFLSSVLVRFFGKDYGLIGIYMEKIAKLKFLIHFYILSSFFNDIKTSAKLDLASNLSTYVPTTEEKITLNTIDLSNILNFIKLLSDFDIMPGLNKYLFSSKFVRFFGSNFLPALEDPGRFYASIYISSLRGQNIIPGFIKKYNQREYSNMIQFTHTSLL